MSHSACGSGDVDLIRWHKQEQPIIPHPPENMKLTGFRDPYIIQTGGPDRKWKMLLGSGIEGKGGTLLVYESTDLTSGVDYLSWLIPTSLMTRTEVDCNEFSGLTLV